MLSERHKILANRVGLSYGIGDPGKGKPSKSLTYEQRNKWSDYAEKNPYIKFDELWSGFSKLNPKSGIDRSVLKSELDNLMAVTQTLAKRDGAAVYPSVHTGYAFPKISFNGVDYGRVDKNMMTQTPIPTPSTSYPTKLLVNKIPSGVTDIWFDEQKGLAAFEDPHEGVIKYADKTILQTPEAKRISMQRHGINSGILNVK